MLLLRRPETRLPSVKPSQHELFPPLSCQKYGNDEKPMKNRYPVRGRLVCSNQSKNQRKPGFPRVALELKEADVRCQSVPGCWRADCKLDRKQDEMWILNYLFCALLKWRGLPLVIWLFFVSLFEKQQTCNWRTSWYAWYAYVFNIVSKNILLVNEKSVHLARESCHLILSQDSVVDNFFLGAENNQSHPVVDWFQTQSGEELIQQERDTNPPHSESITENI